MLLCGFQRRIGTSLKKPMYRSFSGWVFVIGWIINIIHALVSVYVLFKQLQVACDPSANVCPNVNYLWYISFPQQKYFRSGKNLDVNSSDRFALLTREPFLFICKIYINRYFTYILFWSVHWCASYFMIKIKERFSFPLQEQSSAFWISVQLFFSSRIHSRGALIPLLGILVCTHTRLSTHHIHKLWVL